MSPHFFQLLQSRVKMFRFIIFVAFFPMLLFADPSFLSESEVLESANTPLATLYGAPETNILGVNVINGDYNYSCTDFNLPGADPLIFQRNYSSSRTHFGSFFNGWSQNFSNRAFAYNDGNVLLSGALAGDMPFQGGKNEDLKIRRDIFKKGVTNYSRGQISGRSNIKNMRVKCLPDGIKVINPDGSEHLHSKFVNQNPSPRYSGYRIAETIKPNRLKTTYSCGPLVLHNVTSLTYNNEVQNEIKFDCPDYKLILSGPGAYHTPEGIRGGKKIREANFSIPSVSKDGLTAKYSFHCRRVALKSELDVEREGFTISMSKFESSHLPSENYYYTGRYDRKGFFKQDLLTEREGLHHRTLINYYRKGDTEDVYGSGSEEISEDHIAHNRVKQIRASINGSEDLRTFLRFTYHENDKSKDAFTDVYNDKQHLTRFHYSTKNYRLSCVERYKGTSSYSVYRRERLQYGKKSLEGDLLFKTIESSDGTIHYGENFEYDCRGNVLKRKLHFRTFTDPKIHEISTEENHHLKGGEVQSTTYTYNALNLPTSQDDGRLKTLLTYHTRKGKETNLLESKLIQNKQGIKKREFYEFDKNGGCILKIEDDGSKSSQDDLAGVKSRKITHYINRQGHFAGLPLEIDIWSSNGQAEQRISRMTLEYNSHGHLEKETHYDANNQFAYEIQKIRDLQGNITNQTDPIGQATHRRYNEYGSLLEEQGPNLRYLREFTYDWLQRPIKETLKCEDGIHLTIDRQYDLEGKLTKITNPYGFQTEFKYNEQGCPIEITYPPFRTEVGKWIQPQELKEYNFLGHLISETDAKGAVTLYIPNDAGLPLKITSPDGTSEHFTYSIYGEILEKIQRNGSKIVYTYDDFSRLKAETTYDRNGTLLKTCSKEYSGLLLRSETDGEGLKTTYIYDYAGRVSEVSRGKALTKNVYNSLGQLTEEQRYFGENDQDYIATRFTYDFLNRVTCKEEVDANGQIHSKVETTYDPDGNIATSTTHNHAGTATTTQEYDCRGHLKSSTDALGRKTHYNQRYDFFLEDKNLPCLEVIDPTGVKTTTISSPSGAVIITQVHSPFGQLLSNTEMFYDLKGNMVRKEEHLSNETITTLCEYDSSSKLIRQVNGAGTSEQIITIFVYNSFGELSETNYSDGTSKYHTYDGIGRLLEEWSDDNLIHYEYTYNGQDLPTRVLDCNTKKETIRKYSREGNLKSEQFENGLKINYRYDRMNRLIECIYPDGSSVKQTYNPAFLSKVERIKNDSVAYSSTFEEFDLSGKPKKIVFPKKSGKLSFKYDPLNRPKSLSYPHYKEKKIRYDKRGLLTSKIVNDELQTYDHDDLQQLTLEKTAQYSHTYENDALHRQISVDGFKQMHNAVHQLTHGAHDKYKYDAKGRRKQDSKTKFTYDKFDRLIKVEQGNLVCSYTYDAFNRKMSRTTSGDTLRYLYSGHEEIGSYRNKKCIDLKILSSKEGTLPIAIEQEDHQYAPIISSQGHIVGLVELETGELADLSAVTMFGKDLAEKPLSPWRFCGKRHEESSLGIIDFGFRFYDPHSAQWLSQDPLGESAGPNLYAYVKNSPACHIDRYGLMMSDSSVGQGYRDSYSAATQNSPEFNERGHIGYYDGFERRHSAYTDFQWRRTENYWDYSRVYDLREYGLPELPAGMGIGYINGIDNRYNHSLESTLYLSQLSGGYNIHSVYNATHGKGPDLKECIHGLRYIATEPVLRLHEMWNAFFSKNDSNASFLMICHSQGAIHVRNALLDYPQELCARISVVAIAPAAYIYPESCKDVWHYCASRDFVHLFDREGARRSRETIINLESHPNADWHDHSFGSPTFKKDLRENMDKYIRTGGIR